MSSFQVGQTVKVARDLCRVIVKRSLFVGTEDTITEAQLIDGRVYYTIGDSDWIWSADELEAIKMTTENDTLKDILVAFSIEYDTITPPQMGQFAEKHWALISLLLGVTMPNGLDKFCDCGETGCVELMTHAMPSIVKRVRRLLHGFEKRDAPPEPQNPMQSQ